MRTIPTGTRGLFTFACAVLLGGALLWCSPGNAADPPSGPEAAARLVAEASALLDQYSGDWSQLARAEAKLKQALVENPAEASAYVELARHTMKLSGKLDPSTLRTSEELIRRALAMAPTDGNAYVLLGYVLTNADRLPEADDAFAKARQYRTGNGWLYLNEADLRERQKRPDLAEKSLLELAGSASQSVDMRSRALNRLQGYYSFSGRYDQAERAFVQQIALDPKDPWPKGNFSAFLRMRRLDLVRAERYAREALAIKNYRMARQSLAYTLYLGWAEATIIAKDAKRAQRLFAEAQQLEPDLAQIVFEIGYYPRPHPILYALARQGISVDTMPGITAGTTPLNVAAGLGNQALVAEMIHAGARPDTLGYDGMTSLILAAQKGDVAVTRLLLAAGSDPNLLSMNGKDAEAYATEGNHREVMSLLAAAKTTYRQQAAAPATSVPFKVRYVYRVRKGIPNQDWLRNFDKSEEIMFLRAMTYGDPNVVRFLFLTLDGSVRELSIENSRIAKWGDDFEELGALPSYSAPTSK